MSNQDAKREALAKQVCDIMGHCSGPGSAWHDESLAVADFILAREAEREGLLVEALRDAGVRLQYLGDVVSAPRVWDAVRRWEALDAPPQRTVADDVADKVQRIAAELNGITALLARKEDK